MWGKRRDYGRWLLSRRCKNQGVIGPQPGLRGDTRRLVGVRLYLDTSAILRYVEASGLGRAAAVRWVEKAASIPNFRLINPPCVRVYS